MNTQRSKRTPEIYYGTKGTNFIRTFIAIEVPAAVKEQIREIQREMRRVAGANVAWTKPEGIHLTLKFLGDVDRGQLPAVGGAVRQACRGRQMFELITTSPGGFPRLARPKVLWLGIEPAPALITLQAAVDIELTSLNFEPEERAFHPHLTVGRVKSLERECQLPGKFGALTPPAVEWKVDAVLVMSSQLKSSGAEYSVVEKIELQ